MPDGHVTAELQSRLYRIPRAGRGERELYVVDHADLAPILTEALDRMDDARPLHPRGFHSLDVVQIRARTWLAASMHVSTRRVWALEHQPGRVGLSFADALLTALGLEHLVGELPIYPNQNVSRKRWIERAKADGLVYAAREYDQLSANRIATLRTQACPSRRPGMAQP